MEVPVSEIRKLKNEVFFESLPWCGVCNTFRDESEVTIVDEVHLCAICMISLTVELATECGICYGIISEPMFIDHMTAHWTDGDWPSDDT